MCDVMGYVMMNVEKRDHEDGKANLLTIIWIVSIYMQAITTSSLPTQRSAQIRMGDLQPATGNRAPSLVILVCIEKWFFAFDEFPTDVLCIRMRKVCVVGGELR